MMDTEKKYSMVITPALPVEERHKIETALKEIGYFVTGGGGYVDESSCDISFVKKDSE